MAIAAANSEELIQNSATMRYRPLGRTGLQVSALSMGCMRLGEDLALNKAVLTRALDLGVNYFETTRGYCQGQCQQRVAPGIAGRTTGIIVSGKAGIDANTTAAGYRREIERQLDILGVSHFKFFQVGWFGWDRIGHLLKRGGVLDAVRTAQDEGLIQYLGFTGHDTPDNFIKCIETGLFDSITVPYNLINRAYEPTIKRAGELGVGVVAMCAVAGGVLATASTELQTALAMDLPTPELALRFVLANPDVSTACSGMSTIEMVEQNVATVAGFEPSAGVEFASMCAGVDRLRERLGNQVCTSCGYCMPCEHGVDIPRHMREFTNLACFGLEDWVRNALAQIPAEQSADACVNCGDCEDACPNSLPIRANLKRLQTL